MLDQRWAGEVRPDQLPPLPEAIRREERADAEEQIAQTAWMLDDTPENRARLIRAWRHQVATTLDAIASLEAAR